MLALHRRWLLLACLLAFSAHARSEPPPVDQHDGPLPKDARFRLGSGRLMELVGLAADGQSVLTRSTEGALTVWDVRTGRRIRTLPEGENRIEGFLYGAEAGRKRAVLRQEVEKRRQQPGFPKERFSHSVFSPDHTMLALGSGAEGTTMLLRKTAKGSELHRLDDEASVKLARMRRSNGVVTQLAFSPDGRILAGTFSNGCLILWDTRTAQPLHALLLPRHVESYRNMVFSLDGRLLALSDRSVLYVVETASGQQFWKRPLGEHWIDALAFSPDNRTLAIGDAGDRAAVHLWDLPTNQKWHILQGHRDGIATLVFSPDGSLLLSGSRDQTVLGWDVAARQRRRAPTQKLSSDKLTKLWTDLGSKEAARGQRAVAQMLHAPDTALPFLKKSLPPVSPAEVAHIAALIADLDHAEFARREQASQKLEKIGEQAVPALRKILAEKPSLEVRRRIEAILEAMEAQPLSPNWLRPIRAVQVLETVGTPEARHILEGLAHGADAAIRTHEARAALQRLDRRQAQP